MGSIHLATCLLLVVANVGSFGRTTTISDGNKKVRRNTLKSLRSISAKYQQIDAFLVQETGTYDFKCAPFFNGPTSSNQGTSYANFEPRGVCSYTCSGDAFIDPHCKSEISSTIHQYMYKNPRRRNKVGRVAILNCYRNHAQSTNDFTQQISALMNRIDSASGVNKFVCAGDFNDEDVSIPGLSEITHPLLSHKHNNTSAACYIDKVFSNLTDVAIIDVMNSLENKGPGLGHKLFIVKVGKSPASPSKIVKILKPARLRKAAKQINLSEFSEHFWDQGCIEERGLDLNRILDVIVEDATVTKVVNSAPKDKKIVTLDDIESKIDIPNDKHIHKHFYDFVDLFRKKKVRDTSSIRPKLHDFVKVLELKLKNLNKPNLSLTGALIEETHSVTRASSHWQRFASHRHKGGTRSSASGSSYSPSFPSLENFRKLVFSLSNSNAKDHTGMSTKNFKTILKYSPDMMKCMFYLSRRIFAEGVMPACLKQDRISFLYKRKNCRKLAKNYRPITIAPVTGKVIEKILAAELDKIDDGNSWNHAYKKAKSTQSAVINAIETVDRLSKEAKTWQKKGFNAKVVLMAEDISSAFESIDGGAVCSYLKPFDTNPRFKMAAITRSYLDRDSQVSENNELSPVTKPSSSRSSPQGSILSCRYWRIFDGLATRMFVNSMVSITEASPIMKSFNHISYADDHLSLCLFVWQGDPSPPMEVTHHILTTRKVFDESTKAIGCGMNPDKSEIIIDAAIKGLDKSDFDKSFVWLGYSLSLKDNLLIFNKDKFNSKKHEIRNYVRDIFSYAPTISVRRKIFMVYIAPIIDYYLPTLIMSNQNAANDLELFQKEILKMVLGVSKSCPGNQVEKVLGINPVNYRLYKSCCRFKHFLITSPRPDPPTGIRTRSKKTLQITNKTIAERIRWISSNSVKTTKRRYEANFAKKWANNTNERFSKFCKAAKSLSA